MFLFTDSSDTESSHGCDGAEESDYTRSVPSSSYILDSGFNDKVPWSETPSLLNALVYQFFDEGEC
jgi:hypothetical protein